MPYANTDYKKKRKKYYNPDNTTIHKTPTISTTAIQKAPPKAYTGRKGRRNEVSWLKNPEWSARGFVMQEKKPVEVGDNHDISLLISEILRHILASFYPPLPEGRPKGRPKGPRKGHRERLY